MNKQNIEEFVSYVRGNLSGDEKGQAQLFCDRLFRAFGHKGIMEADGNLEVRVKETETEKTKFIENSKVFVEDYKKCLEKQNKPFDIIFIDPPYKFDIGVDAIKRIVNLKLLSKDGVIVLETDEEERDLKELENINLDVYDVRKYGRVTLIFIHERG